MRAAMAQRPKRADPRPPPRLYLITPPLADAAAFVPLLAAALAAAEVAAVLARFAEADERSRINLGKALAAIVQERGAALLFDGHAELVARAGADGAHLTGLHDFNNALAALKPDRIAGAGGLASRHDAMLAVEAGADYVMFGEPDGAGGRPSFAAVEERVTWWAEVFEAPCVAYAGALDEVAPLVAAGADFVALGGWVFDEPQHVAAVVADAAQRLRLPEPTA
jgi:thiamine-phosphate pyrophosphorylase